MREILYSQLGKIKDLEIRKFVEQALDKSDKDFWEIPCSMTGKHHPPENQGEEGNIRHLIKCLLVTEKLCDYFSLSKKDNDIVLASVFLHDIKKHGEPWSDKTDYEHGKIASDWLEQFELREPEKTEIRNCVRYHMYKYTGTKEDIERASCPTRKELIMQLADFFSSLKEVSWLPGINVKEEDIKNFLENLK